MNKIIRLIPYFSCLYAHTQTHTQTNTHTHTQTHTHAYIYIYIYIYIYVCEKINLIKWINQNPNHGFTLIFRLYFMVFHEIKTKYKFESDVCVSVYQLFHLFFHVLSDLPKPTIPLSLYIYIWGDNTVSVAQGGTATPGATKRLLPPDRVLRE